MIEAPNLSNETDVSNEETDTSNATADAEDSADADATEKSCTPTCVNGATCVDGVCENLPRLALGANHSCAITNDGRVKCWGANDDRQLGRPTDRKFDFMPDYVDGIANAEKIVAAVDQTCVITKDNQLWCWGQHPQRRAANSDGLSSHAATRVQISSSESDNAKISEVALGFGFACVIMHSSSTVQCWGTNNFGQLGNDNSPTDGTNIWPPNPTAGLPTKARQIDSHGYHVCAALTDGQLRCWGSNNVGQIGVGFSAGSAEPKPFYTTPQSPKGLTSEDVVSQVRVSFMHTCILRTDGQVKCWGGNSAGELGNNSEEIATNDATAQPVLSNAKSLALGSGFSCAVLSSGEVSCTGSNRQGQLGIDYTTQPTSNQFETIPNLDNVVDVQAGNTHTCAVQSNGRVLCWGDNSSGQLGTNAELPDHNPKEVKLDL